MRKGEAKRRDRETLQRRTLPGSACPDGVLPSTLQFQYLGSINGKQHSYSDINPICCQRAETRSDVQFFRFGVLVDRAS